MYHDTLKRSFIILNWRWNSKKTPHNDILTMLLPLFEEMRDYNTRRVKRLKKKLKRKERVYIFVLYIFYLFFLTDTYTYITHVYIDIEVFVSNSNNFFLAMRLLTFCKGRHEFLITELSDVACEKWKFFFFFFEDLKICYRAMIEIKKKLKKFFLIFKFFFVAGAERTREIIKWCDSSFEASDTHRALKYRPKKAKRRIS